MQFRVGENLWNWIRQILQRKLSAGRLINSIIEYLWPLVVARMRYKLRNLILDYQVDVFLFLFAILAFRGKCS